MDFVDELIERAVEAGENEACGLVVSVAKNKFRIIDAKNLSHDPKNNFALDPEAWLEVGDNEEVIGIWHSHPHGNPNPSMPDLTALEATGIAWHIVTPSGGYTCTLPSGYKAPYLKRPFAHAVLDCYSLMRDWFNREWGLGLGDYERRDQWWEKGDNLYLDNFEAAGFVRVHDEPQIGDVFLMQLASKVPNHGAIYVGDGNILHHVQGRLSSMDVYGGMWQRATTHQLRHNSRMSNG